MPSVGPTVEAAATALIEGDWERLQKNSLDLTRVGVLPDFPYARLFEAAYPGGIGGKVSISPSPWDEEERVAIVRTPGQPGADVKIERVDRRASTRRSFRFVFTGRDGVDLTIDANWYSDGKAWRADLGSLLASLVTSETTDSRRLAARWVAVVEAAGVDRITMMNGHEHRLDRMREIAAGRASPP